MSASGLNEYAFRYNRRLYRHVSFETILGLAAAGKPISRWDILGGPTPIGRPIKRLNPRRRRTAIGMRQDRIPPPQAEVEEIPF